MGRLNWLELADRRGGRGCIRQGWAKYSARWSGAITGQDGVGYWGTGTIRSRTLHPLSCATSFVISRCFYFPVHLISERFTTNRTPPTHRLVRKFPLPNLTLDMVTQPTELHQLMDWLGI
jgi:hypothetical protein